MASQSRVAQTEPVRPLRVAYMMSRFPKLSETFVFNEILAVERSGVRVDIHPLHRERGGIVHPEVDELLARAHFVPFLSRAVIGSFLHYMRRRPRALFGAIAAVIADLKARPRLALSSLAIVPMVAHHARLMEAGAVDHVHCHFANYPAFAGYLINRLSGIPFSFTAHAFDIHVDRRMLARKVEAAAFVVTISDDNRRLIVDTCGPSSERKVEVIHCGVDTRRFRPLANGKATATPFTILSVGRLEPLKGHTVLLEAVQRIRHEFPVRCRIVGGGPLESKLRDRIKGARQDDVVELMGPRTSSEITALLGSADVFVTPSVVLGNGRREGIPVALMEAMSTGVPVIASRMSGVPELIEHGRSGLLVEPGDAAALATAIRRLHSDPAERRRLGIAGRRRVEEAFDLQANAERLVGRFQAVASIA